jgi:hypothetical protein
MAGLVANGGSKMEGRIKREDSKKVGTACNIEDANIQLTCCNFDNLDPTKKTCAFNRFLAR